MNRSRQLRCAEFTCQGESYECTHAVPKEGKRQIRIRDDCFG